MSNDEGFVKIDYLTLEVGDPVYISCDGSYEFLGEVREFVAKYVRVGNDEYDIPYIRECYTINKDFYNPRKPEDFAKEVESPKKVFLKKVLTNEEIYEMLLSDPSLHHVSLKAARKIEKAVLTKLEKLGKLH